MERWRRCGELIHRVIDEAPECFQPHKPPIINLYHGRWSALVSIFIPCSPDFAICIVLKTHSIEGNFKNVSFTDPPLCVLHHVTTSSELPSHTHP